MESSGAGGPGGFRDNIQKAIDDLRSAGEKATGEVRSNIDSAVQRLRDASDDATSRASDQVSSWRDTLERTTDDVRKELGKLAVRSQSSLDAVEEISQELEQRRRQLSAN
jgi:polyhydroxyalkanoate synthesis regulator phasin